jgi:hypothetical protein
VLYAKQWWYITTTRPPLLCRLSVFELTKVTHLFRFQTVDMCPSACRTRPHDGLRKMSSDVREVKDVLTHKHLPTVEAFVSPAHIRSNMIGLHVQRTAYCLQRQHLHTNPHGKLHVLYAQLSAVHAYDVAYISWAGDCRPTSKRTSTSVCAFGFLRMSLTRLCALKHLGVVKG